MRGHKRLVGVLVALLATLAVVCGVAGPAYGETYGYTVRVFEGTQDMLTVNPASMKYEKGAKGIDLYKVIEPYKTGYDKAEDSRYEQIGFRVAGNDTIYTNFPANITTNDGVAQDQGITQDMDFVIAYGVKGNLVKYTLKFVEYGTGKELAAPQEYYGRVGDKPVAAYEYIEGYRPLYLTITGTLKDNEDENVWTFEYVALEEGETFDNGTTTTSSTTNTTTPGNDNVSNETSTEQGDTTSTSRTETTPGTTTNQPGTTTDGGTTDGGTTTTTNAPTTTAGTTTTTPAGEGTTTTTVVPVTTGGTGDGGTTVMEGTTTVAPSTAGGAGAASNAPSNAGAGAGATAGGADDGAGAQEPAPETREILDLDTPLAGPGNGSNATNGGDVSQAASLLNPFAIALLALALALALIFFFIWKRKKDEEDEPETEE